MKITITKVTQEGNDQDAIDVRTTRDIKKTANNISEFNNNKTALQQPT